MSPIFALSQTPCPVGPGRPLNTNGVHIGNAAIVRSRLTDGGLLSGLLGHLSGGLGFSKVGDLVV